MEQQLSSLITGEQAKPVDPLEFEEGQASKKLDSKYQEEYMSSLTKHFANSIRDSHPELKDASDDEALQVAHQVETPDASPQDYFKSLTQLYGKSFTPPKEPPTFSLTEQSKVSAAVQDMGMSLWNDITALPKGIAETVHGIQKLRESREGPERDIFGMQGTNQEVEKQGMEQMNRGIAHLGRSEAFIAGTLSAMFMEGAVVKPIAEKIGATKLLGPISKNLVGKTIGAATRGGADFSAFMGPYESIREAAKEGATPTDVWNSFTSGATENFVPGAVLGVGGLVGAGVLGKARRIGEAVRKAKTFKAAQKSALDVANLYHPDWTPDINNPRQYAKDFIENLHGSDVANSKAGMKAADIIAEKIEKNYDAQRQLASVEVTPESVKNMPLERLHFLSALGTREEKDIIYKELKNRNLGTSPAENGGGVTKAMDWTKDLKEKRQKAIENPNDVKAVDDAFRAEENFKAWQANPNKSYPRPEGTQPELPTIKGEVPITRIESAEITSKKPVPQGPTLTGKLELPPRKPNPENTRLLGRGANGIVRIEFPDWLHTKLYSYLGKKRLEPADIAEVQKQLGLSKQELVDAAQQYRKGINEFVKGHPPYEESGITLKAPNFKSPEILETRESRLLKYVAKSPEFRPALEKLIENGATEEQIKSVLLKNFEGPVGLSPLKWSSAQIREAAQKAFGGRVKITDTSKFEAIQKEIENELHKEMLSTAKPFADWKIITSRSGLDKNPELLNSILKSASTYKPLLDGIQGSLSEMKKELIRHDKRYANFEFFGVEPIQDWFGGNLGRGSDNNNLIMVNPWHAINSVLARVKNKITPPEIGPITKDLAGQILATMVHEITHQVVRDEGEALSKELTWQFGRLAEIQTPLALELKEILSKNDYKITKLLGQHAVELNEHFSKLRKATDISTQTRAGLTGKAAKISEGNFESGTSKGTQSAKIIPIGNQTQPRNAQQGERHFSSLIQKLKQKLKAGPIHATEEEAGIHASDYIPVQEMNREEVFWNDNTQ